MFTGCCAPYYPCVMGCNKKKNTMYHEDYVPNTFKKPSEDLLDRSDPCLLHVCLMQTEPLFGGLPMCFEDDYPHTNQRLTQVVPPDEYNMTIMRINFAIDENTPCTGKIVMLILCCACTCGLTCLPLCGAGPKAVAAVQRSIQRENEREFYVEKGVEWRLVVHQDVPISWVEVRMKDEEAARAIVVDEELGILNEY